MGGTWPREGSGRAGAGGSSGLAEGTAVVAGAPEPGQMLDPVLPLVVLQIPLYL